MGQFERVEPLYQKSLAIKEKLLGEEHPDTATSYNNLSIFYYNTEDIERAYKYMKKAIEIWERVLPKNHLNLINAKNGLIIIQQKQKDKNDTN
jgi:tetratricopeptide (TPR) repeat protein